MKVAINALTGIPVSQPNSVFISFLGNPTLVSTQTVKGIVVLHLPGKRVRPPSPANPLDSIIVQYKIFSVNVPTSPIGSFTLINGQGPGYNIPKITLQAAFTGQIASSFTVKGAGNAIPANVLINSFPDTTRSYGATPPASPLPYTGTSDQNYINGVIHKIDQVLRPF